MERTQDMLCGVMPGTGSEKQPHLARSSPEAARWRAGFPEALFVRLAAHSIGSAGQRVLDVATGTGSLARGFARRRCRVTALESSEELLAEAARLDREADASVEYRNAPAEQTGLTDASFDVVAAGHCWHRVDRPRAAAEAMRLLVPGGALVIAQMDWLPMPGTVAETTDRLLSVYSPGLVVGDGSGLHPAWLRDVVHAGFRGLETFSFDCGVLYTHEAWRARARTSFAVGTSLGSEEVQAFDRDLRRLLEKRFSDPVDVLHRSWTVVARRPDPSHPL